MAQNPAFLQVVFFAGSGHSEEDKRATTNVQNGFVFFFLFSFILFYSLLLSFILFYSLLFSFILFYSLFILFLFSLILFYSLLFSFILFYSLSSL